MAVLDRAGAGLPPDPADLEALEYTCGCPGFRHKRITEMCLRCLDAYAEGLPYVLKGEPLAAEMRRVAACLAKIVKDDPRLGNVLVRG